MDIFGLLALGLRAEWSKGNTVSLSVASVDWKILEKDTIVSY